MLFAGDLIGLLKRLKPRNSLLPTLFQIHDGSGITLRNHTAGTGIVNPFCSEILQLRNPVPDKIPLRIKSLTLGDRIEHPEIGRRIRTGRRTPLLAAIVGRQEAIHQILHEPRLALAPVDKQVLGEEHGRHHP